MESSLNEEDSMSASVEAHRVLYAKLVTSGVDNNSRAALERAFRCVPREEFMGPGPWHIFGSNGYIETPTADPELLYQDVLIALKKEQGLNNGQPSLHARCIAELKIQPAQSIVHIGAGTGYYSAILAELTGPTGILVAYEIDQDLSNAATNNLRNRKNVVVLGDATGDANIPPTDVIYVSAGVTGPESNWLNAMSLSGRMLLPLTDDQWNGSMLLLQRMDGTQFSAHFIFPASFIPCVGPRDGVTAKRLSDAFKSGLGRSVRSLIHDNKPDESCVFEGEGWWFSTKEVTSA